MTIWPGQSGNLVGYANSPNYPGSLSAPPTIASGTNGNPNVYSFFDFPTGLDLGSKHDITFVGCRFQSNSFDFFNVLIDGGARIKFSYCSFTPLASLWASPPGAAWPSAGGINQTNFIDGVNCIPHDDAYQYGILIRSLTGRVDVIKCDMWGFGNAVVFQSTTATILIQNSWIHDAANSGPGTLENPEYHTDGPGYLDGGTPPSNITVNQCTIASIGNTNALAFQAATSGYNNITISNNYLSGFGYCAALFNVDGTPMSTNCTFQGNNFGSDIAWLFGPLYPYPTAQFTGTSNIWANNKFKYKTGSVPPSGSWPFTSADNNKYIWPDGTMHTTDFTG